MSEPRRVVVGINGIIEGVAKKGESIQRAGRRLAKELETDSRFTNKLDIVEVRWLKKGKVQSGKSTNFESL